MDLDVGKPGAPLKLKTEFVGVDTDLFVKAGRHTSDPCCVSEFVLAPVVDPSTQFAPQQTQETKESSADFGLVSVGDSAAS